MTFQQMRLIPAPVLAKLGSLELEPEIQGESITPEVDDVYELRVFVKVGRQHVGNRKMDKFANWIDDPSREVDAFPIPFAAGLVRKLTTDEFADMVKAEVLTWQRENQPRAVS